MFQENEVTLLTKRTRLRMQRIPKTAKTQRRREPRRMHFLPCLWRGKPRSSASPRRCGSLHLKPLTNGYPKTRALHEFYRRCAFTFQSRYYQENKVSLSTIRTGHRMRRIPKTAESQRRSGPQRMHFLPCLWQGKPRSSASPRRCGSLHLKPLTNGLPKIRALHEFYRRSVFTFQSRYYQRIKLVFQLYGLGVECEEYQNR